MQIRPLQREDGIHAVVEGLGDRFRFRIGSGPIRRIQHETTHMWSVEGAVGNYVLQFIPHALTPPPRPEPTDILIGHFRWETGFLRERLGVTVEEESGQLAKHPSGSPVLSWISRNPESMTQSEPGNATRFGSHATLLHQPDHLLHFGVTGMEVPWTEDELRVQALRAALSYFPMDSGEPLIHPNS